MRISKEGPLITHLLFADDYLIFCETDLQQAWSIKQMLEQYSTGSGQLVNLNKSAILFSKNTTVETRTSICQVLEVVQEHGSAKYLGMSFVIGRSKREIFSYVEEAVCRRVESWKTKLLSTARKEVMIKAVINALPVYVMSCFKLPVQTCKAITSTTAQFWWGSEKEGKQKIHWKAWNSLTLPKSEGGLGFQDILHFNDALLAKQVWRLLTCPNLLMAHVLKARYFPTGGLLRASAHPTSSWL